jgi:AcrR family transcriptional regulator
MTLNTLPKVPSSRRERPAKPALTRAGIVDAALTILAEEGLGRVTMRRIATALDTGAASLYVYVRNTEDLHAQVLDALLGGVELPPEDGPWRERLADVLTSYMAVLFQHPAMARMSMSTHPSGANYLGLLEGILGLLREGGIPDTDAAWGVDLLLSFATVTAVEHGHEDPLEADADDLSALAKQLSAVDAGAFPHIARLGADLLSGTGEQRFQWGLDVLITGILHTDRTFFQEI